ncbi:MAG: DUF5684 domain-containing protein [Microthrixaceae bacterium]
MNVLGLLSQATTTDGSGAVAGAGLTIFLVVLYLALIVVMFVGYWKLFTKLGLPGWMGIVPFVSQYMVYKARGQRPPLLWLILLLIPCIDIIALWFLASDTAEMFGKGIGWKLFLFFIPGLSHLILAFGSSEGVPQNMAMGVGLNRAGA